MTCLATTIKVPFDYLKIQLAINASSNGDTIVFALTESAMYRSVNHGNNWTKCMSGASAGYAFGSFISNDSAIFVLDGYSGIYRSRNNGANWTKVSAMAGNTLANVGDYIFVNVSNNIYFIPRVQSRIIPTPMFTGHVLMA